MKDYHFWLLMNFVWRCNVESFTIIQYITWNHLNRSRREKNIIGRRRFKVTLGIAAGYAATSKPDGFDDGNFQWRELLVTRRCRAPSIDSKDSKNVADPPQRASTDNDELTEILFKVHFDAENPYLVEQWTWPRIDSFWFDQLYRQGEDDIFWIFSYLRYFRRGRKLGA